MDKKAHRQKDGNVVVTFQAPRFLRDDVKQLARHEGRSVSAQMRRIIEDALADRKRTAA